MPFSDDDLAWGKGSFGYLSDERGLAYAIGVAQGRKDERDGWIEVVDDMIKDGAPYSSPSGVKAWKDALEMLLCRMGVREFDV